MGERELIFLLSFTCNYVVSVKRGFLYLLVIGVGCAILLWYSLGLHIIIIVKYMLLYSICFRLECSPFYRKCGTDNVFQIRTLVKAIRLLKQLILD